MSGSVDYDIVSYIGSLPLTDGSMTIDGKILEEEIQGFRVEYANGRDSMEQQINEIESQAVNGTYYRSKKIPARDITVGFVIIQETSTAFHQSCDKLKGLLYSMENVQVIFHDEPNVYYIGTPQNVEIEHIVYNRDGRGTFVIHCSDPFKYDINETVVNPDSGTTNQFTIDYDGRYKSYPILEASFPGDCGYVGFTDGHGVLQFGDPNELDKGFVEGNKTDNILQYSKGTMTNARITNPNQAVLVGNLGCVQNGSITCKNVNKGTITTYDSKGNPSYKKTYNENVAYLSGAGTSTSSAVWIGSGFKIPFNADSAGQTGAKEFFCVTQLVMDALKSGTTSDTDVKQCGMIQFVVSDASNTPIMGMVFIKNNQSAECEIRLYAGDTELMTDRVTGATNKNLNVYANSKRNKYLFWDHGEFSMSKIGNKIDFYVDHRHRSFKAEAVPAVQSIINKTATHVNFFIGRLDTRLMSNGTATNPYGGAFTKLGEAYIRGVAALKYKVPKWKDIPNKFTPGSNLEVNTKEGTIKLDGVEMNELGAIGNEWDDLYLRPGANIIQVSNSSWAQQPTYKLRYRKVYI